MKKYIISLAFLALLTLNASAQKYGYLNSGELIEAIAVKENTDKILSDFQSPLMTEGQTMIEKFEAEKQVLFEEINAGKLSRLAIQERQTALEEKGKEIQEFEKEVEQKIIQKRQELLGPILEKVQEAIDAVAKEEGYSMIFDSSLMNAVLFTTPDADISAKVKAKLGM